MGNTVAQMRCLMSWNTDTERLSHVSGSLKLCDDSKLRELGYHAIHLKRHKYFMLYKIIGKQVFITDIYHDLQDYEGILRQSGYARLQLSLMPLQPQQRSGLQFASYLCKYTDFVNQGWLTPYFFKILRMVKSQQPNLSASLARVSPDFRNRTIVSICS